MYRIKSSGAVKTQGEIRKLHPNVSLPRVWTAEVCEFLGIDPVLQAPQPAVTDLEIVVQDGVVQDAKGNWVQNWVKRDKFTDTTKFVAIVDENGDPVLDIDGNATYNEVPVTKAEQEAEFIAKKTAEKSAAIRAERDKKLVETDWIAVKAFETNGNIPALWQLYRQALRDVTAQETFPESVVWPTKPAG